MAQGTGHRARAKGMSTYSRGDLGEDGLLLDTRVHRVGAALCLWTRWRGQSWQALARGRLQPSDAHVAELHGAGAVLKSDPAIGVLGVLRPSTTFMPLRMTVIFGPFAVMS